MNDEIRGIISGKSQIRYGTNIQATIDYLRKGEESGALDKTDKRFKREETERLKIYSYLIFAILIISAKTPAAVTSAPAP